MNRLSILSLLLLALALSACTKEGPAGPQGPEGLDGEDGNANVKNHSATLAVTNWLLFSNDLWYADITVPNVTEDIASTGMVMVYLQESQGEWYALPFSRGSQSYFFWAKPGVVRVHSQNSNGSPTKFVGKVRIVTATSDGFVRNPDINWLNYPSVKTALNLEDNSGF